ncbi:DNA integration/recombination/invertion protein (plasmid) [Bacillus cereus]|uniref:Transposase from transposon Tn916 n=1 Tax=Bacillus mobilis TaxID=2026190 RepID=A0A1Y6A4B2_9BACI|nr:MULTISPECIES: site-specific integrase [Bacillus]MDV8113466.1 tyrosine-type recombinase/integrase [Bacillus sp. BAU-SS-2023]HDX9565314.1 tyrosine-type recombinase/integrase [Bacillus thuringiensis]AYF05392.1 site-specific integrase [Bacillus mobilis]MCT4485944.1 tyrosine-type recombinase/integrase [Bacillus sp. DN_7.5]MCT6909236.1 tyrosine-type recombinase/integrase [Bacillus cereus]
MAGRTVKKDQNTKKWYFILTHGKKEDGKPRQFKKRGFKTKQEAHKAMLELEQSLTLGTYIQPNKILYKEYLLERFLEDKMTKVKKQTLNTYRWIVEKHIIPAIGDVELTKLNPMIIQGLYNKLTKEKALSDENIQKVHTLINDSLKKAERWGLIARNPAALVDRPKAVKKEITVWNVEEVRQFLKYAKKSGRYYIAFLLALTTGMRQGEILGLRWKDVDFENGCVRITQTLSSDGKELLPYTKTRSGSRTIDLPEETVAVLKKHWLFIRGEREVVRSYKNLDLVVCTEFGTPTHKSNIRRVFKSIIKKADIPKIRFHDMRHTHATLLLLQGVNPKIVSERLGHADVRITLDTYSHLLPSMQKDTAIKFGEMLFGEDDKYRVEINLD